MANANISVDVTAFLNSLGEYRQEVEDGLERVIAYHARQIERKAKIKCPVDTGRLRTSITIEFGKLYAIVGTNVEYAPHVEYGTSKWSGKPFLRPAAIEQSPEFYREILEIVSAGGQ